MLARNILAAHPDAHISLEAEDCHYANYDADRIWPGMEFVRTADFRELENAVADKLLIEAHSPAELARYEPHLPTEVYLQLSEGVVAMGMHRDATKLNAVRLPVPWYVFGASGPEPGPYVGCLTHVDDAFDWAEEVGLSVLPVLAVSPGSPDEAARLVRDQTDFKAYREDLLDVIAALSKRYASRVGFLGIEVADDPVAQVRRGFSLPRRGTRRSSCCRTPAVPGHGRASWRRIATTGSGSTATCSTTQTTLTLPVPRPCASWWTSRGST